MIGTATESKDYTTSSLLVNSITLKESDTITYAFTILDDDDKEFSEDIVLSIAVLPVGSEFVHRF